MLLPLLPLLMLMLMLMLMLLLLMLMRLLRLRVVVMSCMRRTTRPRFEPRRQSLSLLLLRPTKICKADP
jgi:hypothetical protein